MATSLDQSTAVEILIGVADRYTNEQQYGRGELVLTWRSAVYELPEIEPLLGEAERPYIAVRRDVVRDRQEVVAYHSFAQRDALLARYCPAPGFGVSQKCGTREPVDGR